MHHVAHPVSENQLELHGTATRTAGAALLPRQAHVARRGTPCPVSAMREALTTLDTEATEQIASSNGKYVYFFHYKWAFDHNQRSKGLY